MAHDETLARQTTIVRTISEHVPHTFGDNHRNAGYQQGDQIASWQDTDGYYACRQGIGPDGNWYESDDIGPFATREQAEAASAPPRPLRAIAGGAVWVCCIGGCAYFDDRIFIQ